MDAPRLRVETEDHSALSSPHLLSPTEPAISSPFARTSAQLAVRPSWQGLPAIKSVRRG